MQTGPITNHVNLVRNAHGSFAYVTVGGRNEVQVYRTEDFGLVATFKVGALPHGIWPSGDGTRVYVGLENADAMVAIDALTNTVIGNVPIGQGPQAIAYVPGAVPQGDGLQGLQPLGVAGQAAHLTLAAAAMQEGAEAKAAAPTTVTLFDQGLIQVMQAAVTGLEPGKPYVLALAQKPDGSGEVEPLSGFMTNPAGAAIVDALGPIRQIVQGQQGSERRYLVVLPGTAEQHGDPVQVQVH